MLGKKISFKKLAKKAKAIGPTTTDRRPSQRECLLAENSEEEAALGSPKTPSGSFAVYVGEERQRFVVPMGFLSHPLFKMLLEKAYDEFGYDQREGLVVPCTVATFKEVFSAVEGCNGQFDFGNLVEEFI